MNTQSSELENLQLQVNVLKIRTFDAEDKVRSLAQEQEKLQGILANVIALLDLGQDQEQVKIQDIYDAIENLKPQEVTEDEGTIGAD